MKFHFKTFTTWISGKLNVSFFDLSTGSNIGFEGGAGEVVEMAAQSMYRCGYQDGLQKWNNTKRWDGNCIRKGDTVIAHINDISRYSSDRLYVAIIKSGFGGNFYGRDIRVNFKDQDEAREFLSKFVMEDDGGSI